MPGSRPAESPVLPSRRSLEARGSALPEEQRNRLLRRADWRFLLPSPAPRKSICFAAGPLAEATAAISEVCLRVDTAQQRPPRELPEGCDLAVASDPSESVLLRAWAALGPGGACYTEWRWSGLGGPTSVRRRLERAGFVDVECYAPRPAPVRALPELWVPLFDEGAVGYVLARPAVARSHLRRTAGRVRDCCWRQGPALRHAMLLCAVARRPAAPLIRKPRPVTPRPPSATAPERCGPGLREFLISSWQSWGLGAAPKQISLLLLTRGRRSINKVIGLVFAGPDPRPRLTVKLPRVGDSVPYLLNEAAALRALESRREDLTGIPRVLFSSDHAGRFALGETVVEGSPVAAAARRESYSELAEKGTDWLGVLATAVPRSPPSTWWHRLVEPVLLQFEQAFGGVVGRGSIERAARVLSALGPLPVVVEHRDFAPWNLLITRDGNLGVLDWESAETRGLPMIDLVYYLTYLAAWRDGAVQAEDVWRSWRATLDRSTPQGRISAGCLLRYQRKCGVDAAQIPALRLLTWMIHSRSEYLHLLADGGGVARAETRRSSLFLRLWEGELRLAAG